MPRVLVALWGLRNQAAYERKGQDREVERPHCMDMSLERNTPPPQRALVGGRAWVRVLFKEWTAKLVNSYTELTSQQ